MFVGMTDYEDDVPLTRLSTLSAPIPDLSASVKLSAKISREPRMIEFPISLNVEATTKDKLERRYRYRS